MFGVIRRWFNKKTSVRFAPPSKDGPRRAVDLPAHESSSHPNIAPFPELHRRTAILVIHGMGAQKPYTTLDQFGRGISGLFGDSNLQRKILFRHFPANINTGDKDWTQAFLRFTPRGAEDSDRVVDIFEYYWAPVITGLVTTKQSLQFLLFTALTPFQYLRDNLLLMNQVYKEERQRTIVKERLKIYKATTVNAIYILVREFARMLFIFLPLITLFAALYGLIAQPLLSHFAPTDKSAIGIQKFFDHWTLSPSETFFLCLFALRYLFLAMSGIFLFEEFFTGYDKKAKTCSPLPYRVIMVCFFTSLAFGPLVSKFIVTVIGSSRIALVLGSLRIHWAIALATFVVLVLLCSQIARDTFRRAWLAIRRHGTLSLIILVFIAVFLGLERFAHNVWVEAGSWIKMWIIHPLSFVRWDKVAEYALLATLLYLVNIFLTTAIAGLAVYLGADDLSKNHAARSQILHECTVVLLNLLQGHADLGGGNVAGNTYDRVLIASHSLGSVIGYDMLNQLIVRKEALDPQALAADFTKIKGMLTFGSPLNKVMYFFRTRTSRSTTVLERILFQLHPFRLQVPLSIEANGPNRLPFPYPMLSPFGGNDGFRWLNAYSPFDLISGKLFFYSADSNARIERGVMPWTAHTSYWENPDLYRYFASLL